MKTIIRTVLCAVALMLTAACQKAVDPVNPVDEGKGTIDIRVNGLMGEYTQVDGTKSSMVNTVRISWENDDIVYVFDGTQCLGSLVASLEGDEDRYALLSTNEEHTVAAPAEGTTKLTLIHSPLLTEAPAVSDGAVSISLAEQSGAKAPFVAYATLDYTGTTITNAIVPFKFATSVIKVNCTGLTANTAIDNATLSNVNTKCKLTLSGDKAPVVAGGTNGAITRTGDSYFAAGKVNAEGEAVFQIAVPALEEASQARVLTVAQGSGKVKDKNFSMKGIEPATSVNTVCQLSSIPLPAGALPGEFSVSATKQVYFSKGNLYADASGATPVSCFEANQYDFRTYPGKGSCINGTYDQNSGTPSGHCGLFTWSSTVNAAVGTSTGGDFLFTNDPDDAKKPNSNFTVKVGDIKQSGWRTLTVDEWQNLFKTDTPNRMVEGKPCYSNAMSGVTIGGATYKGIFLYPDDYSGKEVVDNTETWTWDKINSAGIVFLPAAGGRSGKDISNVGNVGDNGYYWSSTTAYGSLGAYYVYFESYDVFPDCSGTRGRGFSVRLVIDAE